MTISGFIILVLLILFLVWIYVELGSLPGKKARERNHPQADAINVLGWLGLLLGIAPWLVALVWAYTRVSGPFATGQSEEGSEPEPTDAIDAQNKSD
jgi:hypothetical protein